MDSDRPTEDEQPAATDTSNFGDPSDEDVLPDTEPIGPDNIREGRVRGVMGGGPTRSEGQGQGG